MAKVMNFEGCGNLLWENEANYDKTVTSQNANDRVVADTTTQSRRVLKDKRRSNKVAKGKGMGKGLKWRRRQKRRFRKQAKKLTMKKQTVETDA